MEGEEERVPEERISRGGQTGDNELLSFSLLPQEILHYALGGYCDASSLGHLLHAYSLNSRSRDYFWSLLTCVVGHRIANCTVNISPSDIQKDYLPQLAHNILDNLDSKRTSDRLRAFGMQLSVMRYLEEIQSTIWCGYIEFREPSSPRQEVTTAKVVVKSETDGWSWTQVYGWNRSFSSTIRVTSQQYNFFPVKPRGHIFGATEHDQDIIKSISSRLEASDQVMTLRAVHPNGFVLRIVSPEQAHQRLARLGASLVATFTNLENSLVCSWECPDMNVLTLSDSDKIETIDRMVRELDCGIL